MSKNNLPLNYNFILSVCTYCYQERFKEHKLTNMYSACKNSKVNNSKVPTVFSFHAMSEYTSAVQYCMHSYLFVTTVNLLRKQLGMRSYYKWYHTWSEVIVIYEKKVGFQVAMKCISGLESAMCLQKIIFCFAKIWCNHIFSV